jgi:hypothetical protein
MAGEHIVGGESQHPRPTSVKVWRRWGRRKPWRSPRRGSRGSNLDDLGIPILGNLQIEMATMLSVYFRILFVDDMKIIATQKITE